MKGVLPKFGFALLAVLILAAILLSLGQRESRPTPSAHSFNPSGLHAFQELLERNGIQTRIDRLEQPSFTKPTLVIAAYVESGPNILGGNPLEVIEDSLEKYVEKGGRVLVLPFDEDFRARSYTAIKASTEVVSADEEDSLQINTAPTDFGGILASGIGISTGAATFLPIEHDLDSFAPWSKKSEMMSEPFVAMSVSGQGILCRTADGLFVTNRFIDRGDNAKLGLQIVRSLLPEGGEVVFTEASLGAGIPQSLSTVLGPWAQGAWNQVIVLFVVVVITLGIRFGLPQPDRRRQVGQREMVDAIAHVYERAKSSATALNVAYESADRRIKRSLKLPAHIGKQERDRMLPESLALILARVEDASQPIVEITEKGRQKVTYKLKQQEALELLQILERELNTFDPRTKNRIS